RNSARAATARVGLCTPGKSEEPRRGRLARVHACAISYRAHWRSGWRADFGTDGDGRDDYFHRHFSLAGVARLGLEDSARPVEPRGVCRGAGVRGANLL